jgi:hypothetical protein
MPPLSEVHIDRALTNVSVAYINETFIADRVAIPLPVDKRSDDYFVYSKDAFLRVTGVDAQGNLKSLRQPGAEAIETTYDVSFDNFRAHEYSLKELVTDAEVQTADNPLQPDVDATIHVTERLKLDNEYAVARIALNPALYNTANKVTLTTGGTGTSWAQYASVNSQPFTDIKNGVIAIRKGIMREANKMALTIDTGRTLADHPLVKDLIKYVHPEALTMSGLLKVIRGLEIIEGSAQYATSAEGAATFTSSNIWVDTNGTNVALIYYASMDTGPRSIHFMRTFDAPDATTNVRGIGIRRYRWEPKKGQFIEGAMTRDWKMIAKDQNNANGLAVGGYLISAATA